MADRSAGSFLHQSRRMSNTPLVELLLRSPSTAHTGIYATGAQDAMRCSLLTLLFDFGLRGSVHIACSAAAVAIVCLCVPVATMLSSAPLWTDNNAPLFGV